MGLSAVGDYFVGGIMFLIGININEFNFKIKAI